MKYIAGIISNPDPEVEEKNIKRFYEMEKKMEIRYLSLFSGVGGFEIGIERAFNNDTSGSVEEGGIRNGDKTQHELYSRPDLRKRPNCIGYSEIDPYADAIYKYNFGGRCETDKGRKQEPIREGTVGEHIQRQGDIPDSDVRRGKPEQTERYRIFNGIHNGGIKNYGDCTKINPKELPDFDLLVGGFPCQAFSIAGKRRGFEDTRGTLIFDVLRILKKKQPRHFILENVKGLLSHDSGNTFKTIITSLNELGYAVEWQVLNAKNFGVPQNRERVFIVGHLGGFGGRQIFPIRKRSEWTNESDEQQGKEAQVHPALDTRVGSYPKWGTYLQTPRIRRLTPTECERLMGYPDDWTKYGLYGPTLNDIKSIEKEYPCSSKFPEVKEMSDTRRYKACGNGVVSNVVEEVVRRLYV